MWLVLILAVGIAYAGSLGAPFVFDDVPNLLGNPALHADPGHWGSVEGDPGATLSGRPLILASFVLNKALTGLTPAGFRTGNLLIHATCAVLLFSLLCRILAQPGPVRFFSPAGTATAFVMALLWAVHPLQTSSVTYVIQRAESLTALCYLGTLCTFMRAMQASSPGRWLVGSVVCCTLGMTGKETMATAPVAVLLLDAAFVAGGVGAALRRRGHYYAALAATWLVLGAMVAATGGRGGTAGFDSPVGVWTYLLTQCDAIVRYVALIVWPHPLIFDYGTVTVDTLTEVWWQALLLLGAVGAAIWSWFVRPMLGFVLLWFFLLLAPSSSLVPIASQTAAEHRLYLALLGPLALAVGLGWRWLGTKMLPVALTIAVVFGFLTYLRNRDYRSELVLWADNVEKLPANTRARINLARAQFAAGQTEAAEGQIREALRLDPASADAHYNLGVIHARSGRLEAAETAYREAVRLHPSFAEAWNNLGSLRVGQGNHEEALTLFRRALEARPRYADAHANLALALLEIGRTDEAVAAARTARSIDPRSAAAAFALGNASIAARQWSEAHAAYTAAILLRPGYAEAHNNLANVLLEADRVVEALTHYEAAAQADSGYVEPRRALAAIYAQTGRHEQALRHAEELVRLQPQDPAFREQVLRLRAILRLR